jgi:hypothetical protein
MYFKADGHISMILNSRRSLERLPIVQLQVAYS